MLPGHKLCSQEKNSQSKKLQAMPHANRDTGVSLDYSEIRPEPSPLHMASSGNASYCSRCWKIWVICTLLNLLCTSTVNHTQSTTMSLSLCTMMEVSVYHIFKLHCVLEGARDPLKTSVAARFAGSTRYLWTFYLCMWLQAWIPAWDYLKTLELASRKICS